MLIWQAIFNCVRANKLRQYVNFQIIIIYIDKYQIKLLSFKRESHIIWIVNVCAYDFFSGKVIETQKRDCKYSMSTYTSVSNDNVLLV